MQHKTSYFMLTKTKIMQHSYNYILILLLLHEYLAQDTTDQETDKKTKNAVDELLTKINEISEQSFANAPYSEKLEMLQKVEAKLKKGAKSLGNKGERYVKLIMKGIKAKALNGIFESNKTQLEVQTYNENISKFTQKNTILSNNRTTKVPELESFIEKHDDSNRDLEKTNLNIKNETESEDANQNVNFVLTEQLRRMNSDIKGENITHERSTQRSFTPTYECDSNLEKICINIKQMRQLACPFDDSFVPIERLCNGATDCVERTDEKYCTSQVTERIQNANKVIYQADKAFQLGCLKNKSTDYVISSQIIVLRSVLQAQEDFVEKYKYFNRSLIPNSESFKGEGTIKRAANEISVIISSLSLALESELCSHRIEIDDKFIARKFNDVLVEEFDNIMEDIDLRPKLCICKGVSCENFTTCTDACKRICWQKYSLTRWACPSINETENVPLSVVCDGKFDCFDQSDEKDCVVGTSFAKFEAHNIFKDTLSSLSVKATSKEYEFIRNKLLSLHKTIEEMQKYCMESEPDLKIIRALRHKCFSALSSIYSETLMKSSILYQKSEVYLFLSSLNEKIVNALKRSHTGNIRLISRNGCYCRKGRCSMPKCTSNCVRSCIAEPWLTRYFCKDSSNKSVSLNDICNGKPNCPGEDDETDCRKDVCRRHHLTLLRNGIQKIGKKQEGTSMGELLATWKVKVSSTVLVAENSYRPDPSTLRDIIRDILRDLVNTYGAVKDYRKNNEYALQEFIDISRFIMNFVKSCGL